MAWADRFKWFEMRPARNRKPVTYTCPLCGKQFPSLLDHALIFPEGDHSARRHAHTACVAAARRAGKLPSRAEWERGQRAAAGAGGRSEGAVSGGAWERFRRAVRGLFGGTPRS